MNINLSSLWFDLVCDLTRVYRFSSRRFIHLTTNPTNSYRKKILRFAGKKKQKQKQLSGQADRAFAARDSHKVQTTTCNTGFCDSFCLMFSIESDQVKN